MIRLPLTVVRLLPRRWAQIYADCVRFKLGYVEVERARTEAILEALDPKFEYTLGFHEHLQRKLEDNQVERFTLARHLGDVDFVLYPSVD